MYSIGLAVNPLGFGVYCRTDHWAYTRTFLIVERREPMREGKLSPYPYRFFKLFNSASVLALMTLLVICACASRQLPQASPPKAASQALAPAAG
jgi:hypothetical protein